MNPRPIIRRLLNRLPIGRRLLVRLERTRGFPLPEYQPGAPTLGGNGPGDAFLPPNPATLAAAATSQEAVSLASSVLDRLTPDPQIVGVRDFYRSAQHKFGQHWRYADILTTLSAAALLTKPTTYLEIGVRTGRSAAMVAAACPDCAIYGFDLWTETYYQAANPGPDFVRKELRGVGHQGEVTLITGDSRRTVPAFLREHPDLYFDLITVDGDHSVLGAATDLANVLPRLKIGGLILFDDIRIAPHLYRVWQGVVKADNRYLTWEFRDSGFGVGVGVRVSDEPAVDELYRAATWRDA